MATEKDVHNKDSNNKMELAIVDIERNGKTEGQEDIETSREKKEIEADSNIIVEGGVTYDDSDWKEPTHSNDPAKDGDGKEQETVIAKGVFALQKAVSKSWRFVNGFTKGYLLTVICLLGYIAYFIVAMLYERLNGDGSIRLLVLTVLVAVAKTRFYWRLPFKRYIIPYFLSNPRIDLIRVICRWGCNILLLVFMLWILIDQGIKDPLNLQPLPGIFVMIFLCLAFSSSPSNVNWHTIYWSIGLQFVCALFVMKTSFGEGSMIYIQDRLNEYFDNIEKGCIFLFGEEYGKHYLIFRALPVLFFSNATICLLYYLGAIQIFIGCVGSVLQFVLDTSRVESTVVAASIFLDGPMSILSVKPYLGRMNRSQLFIVTTSIFSSIGGAYIGILAGIGVNVSNIIPAMLMSAPATFTVCKLIMPDEGKVKQIKIDSKHNEERKINNNILEAVHRGAVSVLGLMGTVIAVTIVFYAFITWINHTLGWFGDRVGIDNLTMELIFSYLMYPVSMAMGVEFVDCKRVATLMGYRIASGNIIAFQQLQALQKNKVIFNKYMADTNYTGSYSHDGDDIIIGNITLVQGILNERSNKIITYALCGFSSIVSVGFNLGVFTSLVPRRKTWFSKIFLIALIAGNIANCMTGAFAGLFYYQ